MLARSALQTGMLPVGACIFADIVLIDQPFIIHYLDKGVAHQISDIRVDVKMPADGLDPEWRWIYIDKRRDPNSQ